VRSLHNVDVSERLAHFKAQRAAIAEALGLHMGGGSSSALDQAYFYLIDMLEGAVACAPFSKGDRVELNYTPEITASTASGWLGGKHYLVEGSKATIACVSFGSFGWGVDLIFDDESWIDSNKVVRPIEAKDRHLYGFNARRVRAIAPLSTKAVKP